MHDDARRDWLRARELLLQHEPQNLEWVHFYHGRALRGLRRFEEAIEHQTNAIKLNRTAGRCFAERGFAYLQLGQDAAADRNFQEAIRINPAGMS